MNTEQLLVCHRGVSQNIVAKLIYCKIRYVHVESCDSELVICIRTCLLANLRHMNATDVVRPPGNASEYSRSM